jgi:hypothetical protein
MFISLDNRWFLYGGGICLVSRDEAEGCMSDSGVMRMSSAVDPQHAKGNTF